MVQRETPPAVSEKIAGRSASRLPLRDIYRIVCFKYHPAPRRNKEVVQTLRQLSGYQQQSEWSLWKAVERALSDPRAEAFLKVNVCVPVNEQLGEQLRHALGLDEVVVIPALDDPIALSHYLGMAAAQVFGPRLRPGQGLGFSGGRGVGALGQTLQLPLDDRRPFRLYALSLLKGHEVLGVTAEGIVEEIVARHLWGLKGYLSSPERCPVVGLLDPAGLSPSDLDWAFIGVGALTQGDVIFDYAGAFEFDVTWARQAGIVAEMLFHPFCADGLPPRQRPRWLSKVVTVSLALLRAMVREGKPVVVVAGGREKALAVLSVHRAQRAGGPLFNRLVTDEACAKEALHLLGQKDSEILDKAWQKVCQCFLAVHWRFLANERCRTVKEVARKLSKSRNKASRLLHEALHGTPPLAKVEVVPPVPEPVFRLDLEAALLQAFPLREARVVQPWDGQHSYQAVGAAAAQLVLEWLKNASHLRLGLGSGRVRIVVDALGFPQTLQRLTALRQLDITVLESLTWPQTIKVGTRGAAIANSLMVRCLGDRRLRVRLYHEGEADLHYLDGAVVEVGGMYRPAGFLHDLYLRRWGIGPDSAERIAGQILNRPFDDDGHPLPSGDLNTSPPLETFRQLVEKGVPVIGICAARDEWTADTTRAALAAIRGRLINCLVTDAETAINLLAKSAHPV